MEIFQRRYIFGRCIVFHWLGVGVRTNPYWRRSVRTVLEAGYEESSGIIILPAFAVSLIEGKFHYTIRKRTTLG